MSVANYCILVACVLPIVCAGLAKSKGFGKRRREGGYDNNNPREWMARLSGWQARANAAQANSFEALPLFIAGVLAAQQLGAEQARVDMLALSFITFRLIYIGLYLADQAPLRSLAWAAGFFSAGALFFV
ncbi:MAG: MAPEG family protein [Roseateles asaccharophilus]|uniref:Putative MAPEG superfamily protein n=1 Tax=Roseateles asaccharophilus TaxID=582607 RepID=A0A4R6N9J1_9BURK|nr:MAPEG family protein [Roseateles asaccharophilus]MDN3543823.1 MAPEG family protein [Roseateles asaccharophilus]TDP11799.1 putative MAPEG superfamily protein [Roseateles asaccharophilus]